jgi:hypothetical protein
VAEVVGVYDVPEAPEPCHPVEMIVPADDNVGDITQADPELPESDWQVPWDERVMGSRRSHHSRSGRRSAVSHRGASALSKTEALLAGWVLLATLVAALAGLVARGRR